MNGLLYIISEWISQGWAIRNHKYKPLKGSSYLPLPDMIKNRKGLLNIKNVNDNG